MLFFANFEKKPNLFRKLKDNKSVCIRRLTSSIRNFNIKVTTNPRKHDGCSV